MNTWYIMVPAFLAFLAGSWCSYTKWFRDSPYYLPAFVGLSLLCGWMWVVASRRFDGVASIMFFSLVWDVAMVIAYYAAPLLLKGEGLNWQAYAAAGVAAAGIVWFKLATG